MNPDLWFSITDPTAFVVLLPVGFIIGWFDFNGPSPGSRAVALMELSMVFWVFILTSRSLSGTADPNRSVGTVLLNILFILAIYHGNRIRSVWRPRP